MQYEGGVDTGPETFLRKRLDNYFIHSLALITILKSLTCSPALSSPTSEDSEMRKVTSLGHLVPEISIFIEIINVRLPLLAARGRLGRHTRRRH